MTYLAISYFYVYQYVLIIAIWLNAHICVVKVTCTCHNKIFWFCRWTGRLIFRYFILYAKLWHCQIDTQKLGQRETNVYATTPENHCVRIQSAICLNPPNYMDNYRDRKRQFIKITQKRTKAVIVHDRISSGRINKKNNNMRLTNKQERVPTSIGNRHLIKMFYALWKKDRTVQFSPNHATSTRGVASHKAWLSVLCTSLSTAHRVYFSQIKISQSVLLLAGWCVEVRGGVLGRG